MKKISSCTSIVLKFVGKVHLQDQDHSSFNYIGRFSDLHVGAACALLERYENKCEFSSTPDMALFSRTSSQENYHFFG